MTEDSFPTFEDHRLMFSKKTIGTPEEALPRKFSKLPLGPPINSELLQLTGDCRGVATCRGSHAASLKGSKGLQHLKDHNRETHKYTAKKNKEETPHPKTTPPPQNQPQQKQIETNNNNQQNETQTLTDIWPSPGAHSSPQVTTLPSVMAAKVFSLTTTSSNVRLHPADGRDLQMVRWLAFDLG